MSFSAAGWDGITTDGFITDNWTVIVTGGIFYSVYVLPEITTPSNRTIVVQSRLKDLIVGTREHRFLASRDISFSVKQRARTLTV